MSKINKINSSMCGPWSEFPGRFAKKLAARKRRKLRDMDPEQIAEFRQTFDGQGYDEWYKEYVYHGYGISK